MSFGNVFVGQCIKPASVFSTIGSGKISRCLLGRRIKSRSLRYDLASSLQSGSWKTAMVVRSANWLVAKHSAWFLFGLCTLAGGVGRLLVPSALAEPVTKRDELGPRESSIVSPTSALYQHGKKVITEYSIIGIPGDGRCLFRAVVHGAQIRKGEAAPNEKSQREYADDLREKVVDELVKRRAETEWFIEGDFNSYTKRMRQPHAWGGEPELLMASHVLRMPITVYMFDQRQVSKGLITIAEYGQEYVKENPTPVRVLYDGFGHYDALQLPDNGISH